MGFLHCRTSKQIPKLKSLLRHTISRIVVARRPRLARKSIARSDVCDLLTLGHLDRALHRTEQVIKEDNMLEAFDIIELYCQSLIEHAAQLDTPQECNNETREAAAGIMFAAGWCGDLPELLLARTMLLEKFDRDFAAAAKEGTGIVNRMLIWKLSGDTTKMELRKKVAKEIAADNNIAVEVFSELPEAELKKEVSEENVTNNNSAVEVFSELPKATEPKKNVGKEIAVDDNIAMEVFSEAPKIIVECNVQNGQKLDCESSRQDGMDGSLWSKDDPPHLEMTDASVPKASEHVHHISNSNESNDRPMKSKRVVASVRTRR